MSEINLVCSDCEKVLSGVPSKSFDMILACPPYGEIYHTRDKMLNWELIWPELLRVATDDAAIVLVGSQKLERRLIALSDKYYKFSWYWIKEQATNFCNLKIRPGNQCTPIPVFSKENKFKYFPQMRQSTPTKRKIGGYDRKSHAYRSLHRVPILKESQVKFPTNFIHARRDVRYKFAQPISLVEYLIFIYFAIIR